MSLNTQKLIWENKKNPLGCLSEFRNLFSLKIDRVIYLLEPTWIIIKTTVREIEAEVLQKYYKWILNSTETLQNEIKREIKNKLMQKISYNSVKWIIDELLSKFFMNEMRLDDYKCETKGVEPSKALSNYIWTIVSQEYVKEFLLRKIIRFYKTKAKEIIHKLKTDKNHKLIDSEKELLTTLFILNELDDNDISFLFTHFGEEFLLFTDTFLISRKLSKLLEKLF